MVHVDVDKANRVLRLDFSGAVDVEQSKRALDELTARAEEMPEGFRLLTDLTGLESMEPGCARYISKAMDLCNRKGVKLVVRVIPDQHKDIGFNILSIFHYLVEARRSAQNELKSPCGRQLWDNQLGYRRVSKNRNVSKLELGDGI